MGQYGKALFGVAMASLQRGGENKDEEKNIDYWNYDCSSFSVTFNLYDYPL